MNSVWKTAAMRILIAEQDDAIARRMAELFRWWGHTPYLARDGAEAVRNAIAATPQLALIDLALPVMDGFQVIRAVQRRPGFEATRFIGLTKLLNESEKRQARLVGFIRCAVKPVPPLDLLMMLVKVRDVHNRIGRRIRDDYDRIIRSRDLAAAPRPLLDALHDLTRRRTAMSDSAGTG